jgi:hypothetical protein
MKSDEDFLMLMINTEDAESEKDLEYDNVERKIQELEKRLETASEDL